MSLHIHCGLLNLKVLLEPDEEGETLGHLSVIIYYSNWMPHANGIS